MPDYEKMYSILFNAITDAVEMLDAGAVRNMLMAAQQRCEEVYLSIEGTDEKE